VPDQEATSLSPAGWDESADVVIVGSGAGSVCAALVVRDAGLRPLIVEKDAQIGGSTALSGGVLWVPNNPVMKRAGVRDSYEDAKAYLDACAGPYVSGSTPERRHAFLVEGPKMVEYLERHGMQWVHAEGWSDYHEGEYPGGVARSRSLVAQIFDMRRLGSWRNLVRRSLRPPLRLYEASDLFLWGKTWRSKVAMARVAWRLMLRRLGFDLVGTGMAVQGRLFEIALRAKIPLWNEALVTGLITEGARVAGVLVRRHGRDVRVRAERGIIIDAGGFARNAAMRQQYQPKPTSVDWTNSNPGDTGEVIQMAMALGAAVAIMDLSWWNSVSLRPDGTRSINVMDIAKPYAIVVDAKGQRFVNEATSYVAVGIAMYQRQQQAQAVPSWAIIESRHRRDYGWGGVKPGPPPQEWLDSGYMIKAQTIEDLADRCGIDALGLKATIERFNKFARDGVDHDFGRGKSAYSRFLGDPTVKPNHSLGAIEQPPFYAVKIFPGDVGTAGGLVTDEFARVQRKDGSIIPGLYATGNSTATVVGRSYPGAGASIAAAAVFGYIAAKHAVGQQH